MLVVYAKETGGPGDRHLPFPQYTIEGLQDFFIPTLRDVWQDFAGDREGIVMTIWDASRLLWFARPDNPQWCPDPHMRAWLQKPPFKRWGYFPIDAGGPNEKLSVMQRECLLGFNRILAYTSWGERLTRNSITSEVSSIPHGIDTSVFFPRDRHVGRKMFNDSPGCAQAPLLADEKLIGIIATNQTRKDWGLAIESLARVAKDQPIRIYVQIDDLQRHWEIRYRSGGFRISDLREFGVRNAVPCGFLRRTGGIHAKGNAD